MLQQNRSNMVNQNQHFNKTTQFKIFSKNQPQKLCYLEKIQRWFESVIIGLQKKCFNQIYQCSAFSILQLNIKTQFKNHFLAQNQMQLQIFVMDNAEVQKQTKMSRNSRISVKKQKDRQLRCQLQRNYGNEESSFRLEKTGKAAQIESNNQSEWKSSQIRELFKYYDQFGSRWSQMQSYFPHKSQNGIKNKFYGFLKMALRHIFKQLENASGQQIKHLSATQLIEIYQGTRKYRRFKDLIKSFMINTQYKMARKQTKAFVEQNQEKIRELYNQISGIKKADKEQLRLQKLIRKGNNERKLSEQSIRGPELNFNNELTQVNPINQIRSLNPVNPVFWHQNLFSLLGYPYNQQMTPQMLPSSFQSSHMFHLMNQWRSQ